MQGESRGGAELRGTTGQAAPAEKVAPRATTGQAPAKSEMKGEMKGSADVKSDMKADGKRDMKGRAETKGEMKGRADSKSDMKTRADTKADQKTGTKTTADTKADTKSSTTTTTGQGAAGARANLTTEQRTKITTSIKQVNVRPVTNVNFSISIGTRVPRHVHLYPLPVTVYEVYPAWRGYQFILVGDEIIIVNPRTFEIVAVIEA
jgi:hypothetical protein